MRCLPDLGRLDPLPELAWVQALHEAAFTILLCGTLPERSEVFRAPLSSAPGFLARVDGRDALFVDSIEAGPLLARVPGGLELAAELLEALLLQLTRGAGVGLAGRRMPGPGRVD